MTPFFQQEPQVQNVIFVAFLLAFYLIVSSIIACVKWILRQSEADPPITVYTNRTWLQSPRPGGDGAAFLRTTRTAAESVPGGILRTRESYAPTARPRVPRDVRVTLNPRVEFSPAPGSRTDTRSVGGLPDFGEDRSTSTSFRW